MSTIQLNKSGGADFGIFVADIHYWELISGGTKIYFRDGREAVTVTETPTEVQTAIQAAIARPASAVAGALYTISNLTTDRTYDANTAVDAEISDVLGTLITDLAAAGIIQVA